MISYRLAFRRKPFGSNVKGPRTTKAVIVGGILKPFPANYDLVESDPASLPFDSVLFGAGTRDGTVRLGFSVLVGDARWTAVLGAPEYDEPPATTVVLTSPDPNRLCVVNGGGGVLVDVSNPTEQTEIAAFPITDVVPAAASGMLVFFDFTCAVAYTHKGMRWSRTISSDGFRNVQAEVNTIVGECWDAPTDTWLSFQITLPTGDVSGGCTLR